MNINRKQSYDLMCQWVQSESLRKHMLCVEAVMRAYAKKYGEDGPSRQSGAEDGPSRLGFTSLAEAEEMWGAAGLLHDMDYEKFPTYDVTNKTGHPFEAIRELERLNYPKEIIEAILGHALYSGVPRVSNMAKCLFACDELCGFVVACALMRPDRFESLTAESVKRKLKDKKFAAKVSRQDIVQGILELNIAEDEHINFVIGALKAKTKDLGF